MLRTSGRRIDMSTPFVDAMMPDGSRLHVVIPVSTRTADTSARTHGRRRRRPKAADGGYLPHLCRYN
jgi:Flp pilus assembly CpaF family ATPase